MQGTPKVSVGTSTIAGYTGTLVGLALALVAFLSGDHSQQTLGTIVAGGFAALSFGITQIGRYAQAHKLIDKAATAVGVTPDQLTKALDDGADQIGLSLDPADEPPPLNAPAQTPPGEPQLTTDAPTPPAA